MRALGRDELGGDGLGGDALGGDALGGDELGGVRGVLRPVRRRRSRGVRPSCLRRGEAVRVIPAHRETTSLARSRPFAPRRSDAMPAARALLSAQRSCARHSLKHAQRAFRSVNRVRDDDFWGAAP